jgi:hypothetical protein
VAGTEDALAREPQNYVRMGEAILAHGRDPYFDGWPDTLQLDYANPATQAAMIEALSKVARQCDGVRCDMAMLVLPDVFERTWGRRAAEFWPPATEMVRKSAPEFRFMAEVYWDLEWTMLQQGFDHAYDKRLYDRLRQGQARSVREHLSAGLDYQSKLARFMENHDEPRAAASFGAGTHQAAAIITYLTPGLRFFHQGQLEGRRKRISPHLLRAPAEPVDEALQQFYRSLLPVLRKTVVREGQWRLLDCAPAWDGNWTCEGFIAWSWTVEGSPPLLVAVNYAPHQSQCYVRWRFAELGGATVRLADLMSPAVYDRAGGDLDSRGLYLDLPAWGYNVFQIEAGP